MRASSRGASLLLAAMVLSVLVTGGWFALLPEPAQAAVYTVNLTSDTPAAPAPGIPGELRWAINSANATMGVADTITFAIPGAGPHKIRPTAPLPAIIDAVTIDGYTQPGAAPPGPGPANILIELDGTLAGPANGLTFQLAGVSGSAVRGLAINRFSQNGVFLQGAIGVTVEGCNIGTDTIGAVPLPNAWSGITALGGAQLNVIGGTTAASRNVISGNLMDGITLDNSLNNAVMGNYIGTDMIGGIPVPNGGHGVRLLNNATSNVVGGSGATSRNIISGNKAWGITLNGAPGNNVLANFIGTDAMGAAPLPNVSGGVNIANGSDSCTVGGLPATACTISYNTGDGVKVSGSIDCVVRFNQIHSNTGTGVLIANRSAFRDQISQNSIYNNGALGIDLGGDGVTPNDGNNNNPAKPNRGYNFPVFSAAEFPLVAGYAYVTGTAPPNAVVEIYHTGAASDPSGHGQGQTYLTSVTSGADGSFYAVPNGLSNGDEITAIATSQSGDPAGANNTSEFSQNATVKNAASTTFFFAEGYTGTGFQEYLCLGNPGTIPFDVAVTYLFPDGSTQTDGYNVPAFSRITVDVNQAVGAGRDVSIKCEGPLPYIAERPMYFTYGQGWTGGHDAVGASDPAQEWYFAEGYTGPGFYEYICVLNPGNDDADLTFRFQTQSDEIVVADKVVPAHSRQTFLANDLLDGAYEASLKLESTQPVVAERPMYFDYLGPDAAAPRHWNGGHCVMGATSLGNVYFFAEGYTGAGFDEYITIQNPGASEITVEAEYQLGPGQGGPVTASYEVPAHTRRTVYVNGPEGVGEGKDASVELTSDDDFLAERPMYFNYTGYGAPGWTGGHCVIGARDAATRWFFAEGYTGSGFDEFLCIQNQYPGDAQVTITYYPEGGGQPIVKDAFAVPGDSRVTVYVNVDAGEGLSISAMATSDQPVIVERPMYFDFFGITGGHDVVGYAP
ncbi:MAG: DUF5719 family protein [Actinomycetota bacterium]